MFARNAATLLACSLLAVTAAPARAGAAFSWQDAHARILPRGDLEWVPLPFRFTPGASPRYIDFDAGSDDNDGTTRQAPWKLHPWDARATGKAKLCSGIHTYVFKGGVDYRGELTVRDAGRPGDPSHRRALVHDGLPRHARRVLPAAHLPTQGRQRDARGLRARSAGGLGCRRLELLPYVGASDRYAYVADTVNRRVGATGFGAGGVNGSLPSA